jgi:hypothetical protein
MCRHVPHSKHNTFRGHGLLQRITAGHVAVCLGAQSTAVCDRWQASIPEQFPWNASTFCGKIKVFWVLRRVEL